METSLYRYLLLFCICFYSIWLCSQNLVPNGNFERHYNFEIAGADMCSPGFLYDWKVGTHDPSAYCHRYFVKKFGQQGLKDYGFLVNFDTLDIFEGDAMVKLFYHENDVTFDTGSSSYLKTKLLSPLEFGEVYEISMWVLTKSNPAADTMLYSHVGMYLSRNEVFEKDKNRIATDYYFASRIIPDQWTEIKWHIRALCPLQHLIIGAFRDYQFPSLFRQIFNPVAFFIDKVSIRKLEENSLSTDIHPTPYCEYYEKENKQRILESITSLDVHFESNAALLDAKDEAQLDSMYKANLQRKKKIWVIMGHTDSQTAENTSLSNARAESVKIYMQQKYNLSPLNFLTFGLGSAYPIADNSTDAGRLQNRRTTIRTSDLDISQVIYRMGLDFVRIDSLEKAHVQFSKWLRLVPLAKRIEIVVDARLQKLKQSRYWKSLLVSIRHGYLAYPDPKNSFYLDSLYYEDQIFRTPNHYTKSGLIEEIDTILLPEFKFTEAMFQEKEESNFVAVRNYLDRFGYPSISKVGRRQARAVGYIILHHFDSLMYEQCIPIIENLCMDGEGEWDVFAKMTDKLCILKKIPQVYGTQYNRDANGNTILYKIDDIEAVNRRRARIGMLPTTDTW